MEVSKDYVDEYWFENLNLRGNYKKEILEYIKNNYSELYDKYEDIYIKNDISYWKELSVEIEEFCTQNNIKYINYFYHKKLVDKKKKGIKND